MSEIVCETPRLTLRKIVPEDADSLFQIFNHPEVMRFSVYGPYSEEGVQKFIHTTMNRYDRDGMAQWAVVEKSSGSLIGVSGISIQNIDTIKEYEIAYRLARKSWGRGYGTEAAVACRDFGFKHLKLENMISIIEKDNKQSIRVALKTGMALEKESTFHHKIVYIYRVSS